MWLLHQASFAKPHRAAFKNDYCILHGVEAGSWPEKRLPLRHLQDSGRLHMCYYRNESILYCLTQAYSLFTYWKKEKKKRRVLIRKSVILPRPLQPLRTFFPSQTQKMMAFWNGSRKKYPTISPIFPSFFRGKLERNTQRDNSLPKPLPPDGPVRTLLSASNRKPI